MSAGPFALLGIAPTLDAATLKRAYFRALALHPPQKDPEGFRDLRRAYEELTRPGGLAAAYLSSPLDLAAELTPYRERFDAALSQVARSQAEESALASSGERFVETTSRYSYAEAIRAFSPQPH